VYPKITPRLFTSGYLYPGKIKKEMSYMFEYAVEVVDQNGEFVHQIDVAESLAEAKSWLKDFVKEKIAGKNEHYRILEIEYSDRDENEDVVEQGFTIIAEYDKNGKEMI
jgi:hypothetical protein